MKKMIIMAGLMVAATTVTFAKVVNKGNVAATSKQADTGKTSIAPANLPAAVKATLATDAYKGWTISKAWQVKANPDYYAIELTQAGKTTSVNIDANGKVRAAGKTK